MPIFFGLSRPVEAAVDMLALIGTTSYLAYVWHGVDAVAAWTLVPYLFWLGFAAYLSVRVLHQREYHLASNSFCRLALGISINGTLVKPPLLRKGELSRQAW